MKNTSVISKLAALAVFCISSSSIVSQNREVRLSGTEVSGYNAETKLPNFIRFNMGKEISTDQFTTWAEFALNLDPTLTLKMYKTEKDEFGFTHIRYKQYYNNYPVEGTTIITHNKNGKVISVNGDYIQEIKAAASATLSEQQALQKALDKVKATKYMWENKDQEAQMKQAFNDPSFTFFPKGELVVVHRKERDYSSTSMQLAYKFNIYAEAPLYRCNVFVDANTGEILDEQNLICTTDIVGAAATKYSGSQQITSDNYGTGQYRLRETGRGNGVETYNLKNSSTYTNTDFTNTSATWNITGNDQAATDAHFGAEKTYDYYMQKHNRNSIDNAGYKLLSYVHYSTNYVNAFWDGQRMTYGDGSTSQGFTIMTALDVCGHEITHGLTSNTAQLGSGEAGALNEGFSDIFGTTIEFFARPTQHDWLMGADITSGGIRNMANPNQLQQPDTYQGTYWDPNAEVHTNNGPCIYWYYLMCQGGTGTNDKNNAYNVSGIGMDDAANIAFRGLTTYFTSSTNYASARNYTIQAAIDLFGNCSPQVIACTNAWYAVGVGNQYSASNVTASFASSQTTSCAVPATIPFNNTSVNGSTYTWYFGDGTTSTAANPSHIYTQAGIYTVKLVAGGCGTSKDSTLKTSYITINAPASPATTSASRCGSGTVTLSASGGGTLNWYDGTGTLVNTGTSFTTPTLTATTTYNVASTIPQTPVTGAPAANTTVGAGGYLNYSHYLIFDVSAPLTINTVDIYAQAAGARTIELQDATGTTIATQTVNATVVGKNTVTLNFHVNSGTGYRLAATGATINLYRNNAGGVFPYTVGSLVSITGTDVAATNPTYYYYFYNWTVQKDACISATTPVTAVINPAAGTMNVNSTTICAGASATLTASGATTYSWNTNDATSAITISPASTTTYTVTGTTAGCGSTTQTATVTVNQLPIVSATPSSAAICAGSSVTLTATGATAYSWNTGGATASIIDTPSNSATYTVTGTDANNCVNAATVGVTVNTLPTIGATSSSSVICAGVSVTLTATGATSYSWNTGGATASITDTPSNSATYTVTGTDANNCVNTAMVGITVNALPNLVFSLSTNAVCVNNSPVLLSATPAGGTFTGTAVNGANFDPQAAGIGSYTITYSYTDNNNCSNTVSDMMTVNACTGIAQNSASEMILYPNPANDYFIIKNINGPLTVKIIDQTGRLILQQTEQQYGDELSVNTSSLAVGVYQLQVTASEKMISKRLLIQR